MSQSSGNNSGRFYGKYRGLVTNIKDPNSMGRIKFSCPEVFGSADVESAWALPWVTCAYDNGGDIALPKIGETVWVELEQGNANRPIWVGNFWSKEKSPFKSNSVKYGGDTRIINFDGVSIIMKKGTVKVTNSKVDVILENDSVKINGKSSVTIKADTIKLDGTVTMTKSATVAADAKINGISFSGHKHAGVHGETGTPH